MKEIKVSPEVLNRIITLRQRGYSWVGIENDTGVPRRTAKRLYEQHEVKLLREEIRKARANIATEEMRDHIFRLVTVAEYVVDNLEIPSWPRANTTATEFLELLWPRPLIFSKMLESDAVQVVVAQDRARLASESKRVRRIIRQNKILFRSLEEHVRQGNKWQAFEKWQKAWNSCRQITGELNKQAKEMIHNFLSLEEKLKRDVENMGLANELVDKMANVVVNLIWNGTSDTRINETLSSWIVLTHGGDDFEAWSLRLGNKRVFEVTYPRLQGKVAVICANTVNNLCKLEITTSVAGIKDDAEKAISQLEEDWDELRLRPLLLDTRCELCPA